MSPINIDQVIRIVATKGPLLPIQISKELGCNTLVAGALLSQLVEQKRVFVSSIKIGGSPLYYVNEQKYKLQDFAKYLNEKDKRTYELLRQKKILRDSEQPPLIRVSLRAVKDFAIPLEVTFGDVKEIFWKWYLLSDDDARELIRQHLKIDEKTRERQKNEEEKKEEKAIEKPLSTFVSKEEQKTVEPKEQKATTDSFLSEITNFLKSKGITIKNFEIKKKNSEIELTLIVPSAVGQIEYYCKAKDKKRVDEGDISSTYLQGQLKRLPAMLLTRGEMTKKAKELVAKDIKISVIKM